MTIVIDKFKPKKALKDLLPKINKNELNGNLSKHFGELKRNIDGLKYQIEVRSNES